MADTRGLVMLRRAGVEHRPLEYAYRPGTGAVEAAEALAVEPGRMLKSLVARAGDGLVFALVPATAELSLRRLAAAAGAKAAAMAERAEAERATGYVVGGISPLGSRRRLPVFLDAGAAEHDRLCLNSGGRGHIVELATADLVRLTGATVTPLAG